MSDLHPGKNPMITRKTAVVLLAVGLSAVRVTAYEDPKPHPSPDGRHAIFNIGDTASLENYFEIRTREGEVLLSSRDKEKDGWMPTHANKITWSRDGRYALFEYDVGKLKATAIYSFPDRKLIDFGHVADGWTVPVRWVSSRTFVIEHAGPRGGHAIGGEYRYRQTFRIRQDPFRVESVYVGRIIGEGEPWGKPQPPH